MRILITGGAGMLGRKLAARLARDGAVGGTTVTDLVLADVVAPEAPGGASFPVETRTADLADPGTAADLVAARPDVVFHLAAIPSGGAEAGFEAGYRINLDGTRLLLDAIRAQGPDFCPRVVFSSTIAVFGAPFPERIDDTFHLTPLTCYGSQKAMGELLLSDYTRRGFVDGVGIRLPTVCVRPGSPNLAASGFFSNIIREPLNGLEAVLPVADDVRHAHASPRATVDNLMHAAQIGGALLGDRRCLTMPSLSVTVAEQIAALQEVAGDAAVDLIRREPDPTIERIVAGWPRAFDTARADALGFRAEQSFREIIDVYIADELGGELRPRPV
ncbi:MAG: D-erythronate 2-dehydrogenase [Gaiellaceae bacterium]|nr:D-erythronate 2-dehydrogenase [Gaiellaceae bacterium]